MDHPAQPLVAVSSVHQQDMRSLFVVLADIAASGIFFDLNCDEFERDEITEQFVRLCNKT